MIRFAFLAVSVLLVSGCASSHQPENVLAVGSWVEGGNDELALAVGIFDDNWVSIGCDCQIQLRMNGVELGSWQVLSEDFRVMVQDEDRAWEGWEVTVQAEGVAPCTEHQPFYDLEAQVTMEGQTLTSTGLVPCKPA